MNQYCPKCNQRIGSNTNCEYCRVTARKDHRGRPAKLNIYLDDIRGCPHPTDEFGGGVWHEYLYGSDIDSPGDGWDWYIVRSYAACIELLEKERGKIGILSLDHNLGEYNAEMGREVTGYDVLCWLEAKLNEDTQYPLPDEFKAHSANSVGAKRMWQAIKVLEKKRQVQTIMMRKETPCE